MKTAELIDNLRFILILAGERPAFVEPQVELEGLVHNDISSAVSIRYKTCFILCNELVTVFFINLTAPQQCLKQALPLHSACANFPISAPRVLFPKSPSSSL